MERTSGIINSYIYEATTSGNTTYKVTQGIDGDYIFTGYDIEIKTGRDQSISTYGRINIRTDAVEAVLMAGAIVLVVFQPELIPAVGETLAPIAAKAVPIYELVKSFSRALGFAQ